MLLVLYDRNPSVIVESPQKGPIIWKALPCHDVIKCIITSTSIWHTNSTIATASYTSVTILYEQPWVIYGWLPSSSFVADVTAPWPLYTWRQKAYHQKSRHECYYYWLQAHRTHYCREVCKMSQRYEAFNNQSRRIKTAVGVAINIIEAEWRIYASVI